MAGVEDELNAKAQPALEGAPKGVALASIGELPNNHKGLAVHGGQPAVMHQSHHLLVGIGRRHSQHQPNPRGRKHRGCQQKHHSPGKRVEELKRSSQGLKRCRTGGWASAWAAIPRGITPWQSWAN